MRTQGLTRSQVEAFDAWLLEPLTAADRAREAAALIYAQGVLHAG